MSLRSQCIEVVAEVLFHRAFPRAVWGAGTSKREIYLGDAEVALDALLGVLAGHAAEWAAETSNRYMTPAAWNAPTDEEASIHNLLAVLEERNEK